MIDILNVIRPPAKPRPLTIPQSAELILVLAQVFGRWPSTN